jgi:hypothetical protein
MNDPATRPHENIVSLVGRELGRCHVCREPVRFADDFIRHHRLFLHLHCAVSSGAGSTGGMRDGVVSLLDPPPGQGA